MDRMRGELDHYGQGLKGHVRMLCNTSAMSEYLPPVLGAFLKDHPRVSVTDQMLAAGAAIENMLLAASALGYAGCLRSGHSATSRRVRLALGLANEEELAAFLMLGTPAKAPKPRSDNVPDLLSVWE